jgi:hypothetical protein
MRWQYHQYTRIDTDKQFTCDNTHEQRYHRHRDP